MKYAEEPKESQGKESTGVLARERETPSPEPGTVVGPSPEQGKENADTRPGEPEVISPQSVPSLPSVFNMEVAKKHFGQYMKIVDDMFAKAKNLMVSNDTTNVDAVELGTSAMGLHKKILAVKEQVPNYSEAKAYVDAVEATVTMLTEKLYSTNKKKETIVSITKEKISQYAATLRLQEEDRRKKEQEARDAAQKALNDKAKELGLKEAPKIPEAPAPRPPGAVRTITGSSYAVSSWDFEVEDRDLPKKLVERTIELCKEISNKYKCSVETAVELNAILPYLSILYSDTAIRKAVKDGLRNIQGLHIFEKVDTRFKTGK